jgi:hypothetical protein
VDEFPAHATLIEPQRMLDTQPVSQRDKHGQIPKRPEHGVGEQILTAIYGNAAIRVELSVELGKHETHHAWVSPRSVDTSP